jgi:hypothetical protein
MTTALCAGAATASEQTTDEQAFDRSRVRMSGQSIDGRGLGDLRTQRDAELLRKYRTCLKDARFSDAEAQGSLHYEEPIAISHRNQCA